MSEPVNDNKIATPAATSGNNKTPEDIFSELSKDDNQETLDLSKPIEKKKDDKEVKTDKGDIEDAEEDDKEDKEDEDEDATDDELDLLEEELEEPDEEKLELTTPVRRRDILKKYPQLFKDFPYLEKAYYREQQFTEILSTIDDAKAAAESHQVLGRFSKDMIEDGNVSNVLKMIKDSNPETFNNVVDNYMDHLHKVDPSAYAHVNSNLVKNLIIGMVEEAKSSNDDDLRTAALLLNKWAFGSSKFVPPSKLAKETPAEDKAKVDSITQRERAFAKSQVDAATNDLNTRVNNTIRSAIENHIDPNKSMTDYVKKNATRDALEKVTNLIERDTRFQKIVDKLWEKAARANFSSDSVDEVKKAFLSKARSLLAPVLKSARNEALRGMGKRVKDEKEEKETNGEEKVQRQSRSNEPRLSSDRNKAKLDSLKGKSSFEALNVLMGD